VICWIFDQDRCRPTYLEGGNSEELFRETLYKHSHKKKRVLAYSTCTVWHYSVQHDAGARFKSSEVFLLLFVRYQPRRLDLSDVLYRC